MILLKDLLGEDIIEQGGVLLQMKEALPHIKKLGNKPLLNRTFSGVKMGVARVISKDWKTSTEIGRLGQVFRNKKNNDIENKFYEVMNHLNMKYLVYTSMGDRKFVIGQHFYCVPVGNFKTWWSPQIRDIYINLSDYYDNGELDKFPVSSYKNSFPSGNIGEILVDTKEYYLITTRTAIINLTMKYNNIKEPKTYKELYDLIELTLKKYSK